LKNRLTNTLLDRGNIYYSWLQYCILYIDKCNIRSLIIYNMKKTILSLTLFLALGFWVKKVNAQISVGISVNLAPPAIPVYTQPPCPVDGYIWIPGYWAWDEDEGYYWVPGYWEAPPEVGFLWTPGYWGWSGGAYLWHAGYWGPHVGFYGGVNYGCGYIGNGYVGGEWYGGHFRYNTAVTRVNTTVVHNTYINRTVINNVTVNRTSYNGGPHGIQARPTAMQESAMRDHHFAATSMQMQHQQAARQDRNAFVNVNHGRPAIAAVARPMAFNNHATPNAGHVISRPNNTPVNRPSNMPNNRPQMHAQPQNRPMNQPRPQVSRPMPAQHPMPAQRPMPQQRSIQQRPMPQQHAMPQQHPMPAQRPMPAQHGAPPHGGGGGEHHHR